MLQNGSKLLYMEQEEGKKYSCGEARGNQIVGTPGEIKMWRPLSVTISVAYHNFLFSSLLTITKSMDYFFVILGKQMSQSNL
jgi:hypothetical protein